MDKVLLFDRKLFVRKYKQKLNLCGKKTYMYVFWFVDELRRQLNGDANESLMNTHMWNCILFVQCWLCWLFFWFLYVVSWLFPNCVFYSNGEELPIFFLFSGSFILLALRIQWKNIVLWLGLKTNGMVLYCLSFHLKWGDYHISIGCQQQLFLCICIFIQPTKQMK